MKRIPESWRKSYRPLKLFKEDVEQILSITTEALRPDEVRIIVGQFQLGSPQELGEIKEEIVNQLCVEVGPSEQFVLSLKNDPPGHLTVSDTENTELMGKANRVDTILQERQRCFLSSLGYLCLVGCLLAGVTGLMLGLLFDRSSLHSLNWFLSLLPTMLVLIGLQTYHAYVNRNALTIYMCYSYEKPSFFKRNRDHICVGVIVSIVTVLLTLLVQLVIRKLGF